MYVGLHNLLTGRNSKPLERLLLETTNLSSATTYLILKDHLKILTVDKKRC